MSNVNVDHNINIFVYASRVRTHNDIRNASRQWTLQVPVTTDRGMSFWHQICYFSVRNETKLVPNRILHITTSPPAGSLPLGLVTASTPDRARLRSAGVNG